MDDPDSINSLGCRNRRFSPPNRESCDGKELYRFFARIAAALPQWLLDRIRQDRLTVCDWGCAQGDSTALLTQLLSWNVTGMDFSQQAIDSARHAYPGLSFLQENLLDGPDRESFNVLFSSNTLEHFAQPWEVFKKISCYASDFIVLLLPCREFDRRPEHEATFDDGNIPLTPHADWLLVYQTVIETVIEELPCWPDQQILLIYTRPQQLAARQFMLADSYATKDRVTPLLARLEAEMARANSLQAERDAQQAHSARLQIELDAKKEQLHQTEKRIEFLQYREQTLTLEIATLLATKSWCLAPLRAARRLPTWLTQRIRDVCRAYAQGGSGAVARRASTYALKRLRQRLGPKNDPWATIPDPPVLQIGPHAHLPQPPADPALPDIFIFGVIDWHFRIQRPQHLAREFAQAGHRVYYFSNHFEDTREPGFSVERLDEKLPLYQIKLKVSGAPAIYFGAPSIAATRQMQAGMLHFLRWIVAECVWAIVQHAWWYPLATRLQATSLIYDCMDHHEGFGNVPQELLTLEMNMMRRADLLVVTSSPLEAQAQRLNPHVQIIRNAGQYRDFCTAPAECYADSQGRRIIGYYGAIAEWFDTELVARIAQAFPDCLILLVGADSAGVGAKLAAFSNIEMTGEVPYERLPYYLYAFDVCLMPFQVTPLTLATNPVKIYEYLGAGRSIVSVDLPELAQFGDLVRTARSHEEFMDQTRAALAALPDPPGVIEQRQSFAAGQTWAHRVADFCAAISALPRPKVSAIVLTYNNLELTQACLDSLERCSGDVDLEIVLVDNASGDGTPAYLSAWAATRPQVKLILNVDNRGFAAGNNQGLAAANGDYLVILNNDTVVTRGWAWRMANHLRNTPELGIIGPLTNNIGNEAKVSMRYTSIADMPAEARALTQSHIGKWFEVHTTAFFCAMLPRATYVRCGPICEDYGRGFFEDDDYCRRVQAVGLRVGCAEDVFVHHHLSASFDKLGQQRKQALFDANRAIYEKKWGPWKPHRYRNR